MADLRYPIGKFVPPKSILPEERERLLDQIEEAPANLRAAVKGLSEQQLDTPYRPDGWTVRQVLHHVPDSHMNAFIRFKLALTEDEPTIKPYHEELWANLGDVRGTPPEVSLVLLESLQQRWNCLLRSLKPADWKRTFRHPELGLMDLDTTLAMYAWHGRHHTAHVTSLRARKGWN
ncbi:MAG TPA: putative metal-dependent hydrolase [Terriglobales bacterium]|nr:putative metal-dependent hydrolase [Terriglobales bacterium]